MKWKHTQGCTRVAAVVLVLASTGRLKRNYVPILALFECRIELVHQIVHREQEVCVGVLSTIII